VAAGGTTTIVAAAHNAGPDTAAGVTLGFDLPAGAVNQLITSTTGTCTAASCDLGTIAPGGAASVTLSLSLNTPGAAVTTAHLDSSTPDADNGDNAASVTTTVTAGATPTPTPTPPRDTTPPVLSHVKLKGKRLHFTLSEAATVRVTAKPRKRLRKAVARAKGKGKGSIKLPLRRGHVRLSIRATDAAGNRSKTVRRHQ
jgi:hypothetical protein